MLEFKEFITSIPGIFVFFGLSLIIGTFCLLLGLFMDNFDEYSSQHPIIATFVGLWFLVAGVAGFTFTMYIASWFLKPEVSNTEYTAEYSVKEQPKNQVEAAKVVNEAIKEKNLKTTEAQQLLEDKKTKLTVRAEIEEGSNIKEAKLEFVVDSITDKDIDFAHDAIAGIVTKISN